MRAYPRGGDGRRPGGSIPVAELKTAVETTIPQALRFINARTGFAIEPRPILAIPGWWVTEKTLGSVRVLNPKNLPSAIIGRNKQRLTPEQIDLIARQLDEACRDDDW